MLSLTTIRLAEEMPACGLTGLAHVDACHRARALPPDMTRVERLTVTTFGDNWIAIVFLIIATFVMGTLLLTITQIIAPSKPTKVKSDPYESGIPDIKPTKARFTPRFYVVGMLFVIFDLEAAFIYPWAVNIDELGLYGFTHMFIFIALLLVSYAYAWKKGALEWV
jgi:NADH-quinone oxidoreductase subunit A